MTTPPDVNRLVPEGSPAIPGPSATRVPLAPFFSPASVAVIGATDREGSVGRTVMANLRAEGFKGRVYGVNPHREEVLGIRCYRAIGALPEAVDLAVIVTPASTVPGVIDECLAAEVRCAVVISAGFKEKGPEGAALERQIREKLSGGSMRVIGPNCLGVMNPWSGFNATFANDIARPGSVAFLSQSGALLTAILDWSLVEQVGFSAIVSTGSMLDVGWGDLISFFGDDPNTQSILLYMESIGDARSFLSAAREVALSKPIMVIKAGRSEAASRAAASHTGAMTGSDAVFDAAFRRCGVLRMTNISDVFHMADMLGKQPRPRGPRLMILTNAGGPGVLATDALIASGGELAALSAESQEALGAFLPPHWSHGNPVDILGDADPERYARAMQIAFDDPNADGLLAILAPQGMTDPARVAEKLKPYAKGHGKPAAAGKPLLASWMGGKSVEAGIGILNAAGIPTFGYPDTAARAFESMWQYTYNLRGLYETPAVADDPAGAGQRKEKVGARIAGIAAGGRTLLTEIESKEILQLYGIPTVATRLATSAEEACVRAEQTGYPVVLKVHSQTITHKTDVGGVKLNLENAAQVRAAYEAIEISVAAKAGRDSFLGVTVQSMARLEGLELILGSSVDPQFGPIILFGSGGQLVEVYRDRALALPPLNTTLAQRLMEQTKVFRALQGVRGRAPVDIVGIEGMLVRFSQLVLEHPRIREIDINPLMAAADRLLVLDARMILFGPEVAEERLPRPAIRPYPSQFVWQLQLRDGSSAVIRPIRPEDEPLLAAFHETLSDSSVYLRYFHMERLDQRVAHERLLRKCFIDYDREIALVIDRTDPQNGQHDLLGVGRLTRQRVAGHAELSVLVTDSFQRSGLGTELVGRLIDVARAENMRRLIAHILPENSAMRALAARYNFSIIKGKDSAAITAILALP